MVKTHKTKKFAAVKRMINPKDTRCMKDSTSVTKTNKIKEETKVSKLTKTTIRRIEKERVSLFFSHNKELGPPYQILMDTNFINFSIQYKMDILQEMMNAMFAK